jgi:hypothetical protein
MTQDSGERWRPVVGWDGRYEVSDQGRVRALYKKPRPGNPSSRVIAKKPDGTGYRAVTFPTGQRKYVHQLVLEAFVGPPPEGMVCRHLNDIRTDCQLTNLQWGTQNQNAADAIINGRTQQASISRGTLTPKQVQEIRRRVAAGERRVPLAAEFGVSVRTIGDLITRSWRWLPQESEAA